MAQRDERIEKAHELFNILAPSGKEQAALTKQRNEMERAGETPETILLAILGAMWDGQAYGNWPTDA